jgi:hypothetical protein
MNIEAMLAWADELETTEKKQCKKKLRLTSNGEVSFCCIGILDEMRKEGNPLLKIKTSDGSELEAYSLCDNISSLDPKTFWSMNDHKDMSFKEISQEIRNMVKEYQERG